MLDRHRDLVAACVWAGLAVTAVAVSDSTPLRSILGLPMVLLIPGHALLRAVGIRTSSWPQHLAYAVGASLAACIAGGFVLHTLGRLTPLGWALWLWAVTGLAAVVAGRRRELPELAQWSGLAAFRIWPHGVTMALAALIATGAYMLAVWNAGQREFTYTEFWMLPAAGGDAGRLIIGVRSGEPQPQRFDVEVSLDGRPFAVFRLMAIRQGETWTREIPVPVQENRQKAEARLLRPADHVIYRRVSAFVPGA
jgi:uncharacterized membrane protein